jgi:hypothetical protein
LKADNHHIRSIGTISYMVHMNEASLTREVLKPHVKHQHNVIRDYNVLSLGKSQGKSDSDGGYPRYATSINDKWLSRDTYILYP